MPVTNGKITAPISANDPYDAMGMGKPADIGYQLNYASSNLHGNINKWSRNKPMRHTALFEMSDAEKASVGYGVTIVTFNYLNAYRTGEAYVYEPPTGGANAYRIADWLGYDHYAEPFLLSGKTKDTEETINRIVSSTYKWSFKPASDQSTAINPGDLLGFSLSTLRLAVGLYSGDPINASGALVSTTRGEPIGRMDKTHIISVDLPNISSNTTYYALAYLTDSADDSGLTLPIPWDDDNYPMVKLVLTRVIPFSCEWTQISRDGANFASAEGSTANTSATPARLWLKCTMTNPASSALIVSQSTYGWRLNCKNVSTNATVTYNIIGPSSTASGTAESVTIPANSSITIYFRSSADDLFQNFATSGNRVAINLEVSYNSSWIICSAHTLLLS